MNDIPPGFMVPVHRSLIEPVMLGGATRPVAILVGTIAASIGLGLQQWLGGLILWIAGHSAACFAARQDPDFFAVMTRHLGKSSHFSC